jgi:excisionase family DNA binding protein
MDGASGSGGMDRMMKLKEVAQVLGICVRGVYRLIAEGLLPRSVKVLGSSRMPESAVVAYINKLKAGGQ